MVEVGFKFDQRDYAIRLLWELEKLKTAIDRLMTLSRKYSETSDEHKDIMANAGKYALAYFSCHNELMDITTLFKGMKNIFKYINLFSTIPLEVDKLIVSAYMHVNKIYVDNNIYS